MNMLFMIFFNNNNNNNSLSNSNYHKMAYIEEEQVITLFVGSNESIDEIQVNILISLIFFSFRSPLIFLILKG